MRRARRLNARPALAALTLGAATLTAAFAGQGVPASARVASTTIRPPTAPATTSTAAPTAPSTRVPRITAPDIAIGRPANPFPAAAATAATCAHPLATVASWPLRRRVAQLVMIGIDARDLPLAENLVARQHIGAILLRSAAGVTAASVRDDLAALHDAAGSIPPFVAVDEEGGRVQPLRAVAGSLPSARRLARSSEPADVRRVVAAHAATLFDLGVTMVLGPVLDVTSQPAAAVIGDRSFSDDPAVVAEYGAAYAAGLRDGGQLPVIKHFPGHGAAGGDSHTGRVATPSLAELQAIDIPPFRAVMADGPVAVMVGHLETPGLSGTTPASLSKQAITGYLRGTLGFRGLVLTDSLSMGAVTTRWRAPAAGVEAIVAGADMAVFVTISERDAIGVIDALEQVVKDRRIPQAQLNQSVLRIVRAKGLDPCALTLEPAGPRATPDPATTTVRTTTVRTTTARTTAARTTRPART